MGPSPVDPATTSKLARWHVAPERAVRLLPTPEGKRFATVLTHGTLAVEVYAPRGTDPQQPHTRDEIYVVISGRGDFRLAGESRAFAPGDVLFAPAGALHRFENFTEDFATWVFFYGPEGGERESPPA